MGEYTQHKPTQFQYRVIAYFEITRWGADATGVGKVYVHIQVYIYCIQCMMGFANPEGEGGGGKAQAWDDKSQGTMPSVWNMENIANSSHSDQKSIIFFWDIQRFAGWLSYC